MHTATERLGRRVVAIGLLITLVTLAVGVTTAPPALAQDDWTVMAKALTDHECDTTEWHFVMTRFESQAEAPASISVTWSGGHSQQVALDAFTGKTAHYRTTAHLDRSVTAAFAVVDLSWTGQFNLSHGPCGQPESTTPSSKPDDTTPTSEPDDTTPTTEPDDTTPTTEPDDTTPTTEPDDTTPTTQPEDKTPSSRPVETENTSPSTTITPSNHMVVPRLPYFEDGNCSDPNGDRQLPRDDREFLVYTDEGDRLVAEIVVTGFVFDVTATLALGYDVVDETTAVLLLDNGVGIENPKAQDPALCEEDPQPAQVVPRLPYFEDGNCTDPNGDRQLPRDDRAFLVYTDGGSELVVEIVGSGHVFDVAATLALGYDLVDETRAVLLLDNGVGIENPEAQDPAECVEPETTVTTQPDEPEQTETTVAPESTTTTVAPVTPTNTDCDADHPLYDARTGRCDQLPFTGLGDGMQRSLKVMATLGILLTLAGSVLVRRATRMASTS